MTDHAAPTQEQPGGEPTPVSTPAPQEPNPVWTAPPPKTDLMAEIQRGYTAPTEKRG